MNNKKKIIALKSTKGFYISEDIAGYNSSHIGDYFFNGEKPEKTFKKEWFFVNKEPKKIEKEVKQPNINYRFEIIDSNSFPNLNKVYKKEDVVIEEPCYENEYNYTYTEEFKKIFSLYELKSDEQPDVMESIDFECVIIGEVEDIKESKPFSYEVYAGGFISKGTTQITNESVIRRLFDEIAVPSILLHEKPCKLTSKQSFDIVRYYVKRNIDAKYAEVSSDYDFCFSVFKVIGLAEKEDYTVNINVMSKRKPKYETRYRNTRKVQVFEMTYSPENYKGYTPIPCFEGKDEEDLNNNIEKFLEDLMKKINAPLVDCPHCKGMGVITN